MTSHSRSWKLTSQRLCATLLTLAVIGAAGAAQAATQAYWRFETGPAGADVFHIAGTGNTYSEDVPDDSGNGNELSAWITGGFAGFAYRDRTPAAVIPATSATNSFSVSATGDLPGFFIDNGPLTTIQPTAWTVEASFKAEGDGFKTVVGRDAQNITTGGGPAAALYLQQRPGNNFAIAFTDVSGNTHVAETAGTAFEGMLNTYSRGTDPLGDTATWYNVAAVSDGSTLSLYMDEVNAGLGYQLVSSTDISSSPNTALNNGSTGSDGGDWNPGGWSVGRGLFNGGHTDRFYGLIDEVRISDSALAPSEFLFAGTPETMSIVVNTTNGNITLRNTTSGDVTFDYYEIASDNNPGLLNKAGWDSLQDQGIDAATEGDYNGNGSVGAEDYTVWRDGLGSEYTQADYFVWRDNYGNSGGSGLGWTESGGSDANILAELFLDGAGTTLAPGEEINLDAAFNPAVLGAGVDGDLVFKYSIGGTSLVNGLVTYTTAGASAVNTPEPAGALLCLVGVGLLSAGRRRVGSK